MPPPPVFDTTEPRSAATPSEQAATGFAAVSESSAAHGALVVSAANTAATAVTPSAPTARIHWIGSYVDDRHPADLYADIVAGTPDLVVVDARYPETYAIVNQPGRNVLAALRAESRKQLAIVADPDCRPAEVRVLIEGKAGSIERALR